MLGQVLRRDLDGIAVSCCGTCEQFHPCSHLVRPRGRSTKLLLTGARYSRRRRVLPGARSLLAEIVLAQPVFVPAGRVRLAPPVAAPVVSVLAVFLFLLAAHVQLAHSVSAPVVSVVPACGIALP